MRHIALLFALNLLVTAVSVGQDVSHSHDARAHTNAVLQSYVVQLTEIRLRSFSELKLSADDIVKSIDQVGNDGKGELVEIVRLAALEGHESMAQFGKRAIITTGITMAGLGRTQARQTQQQMVGTMVRLTVVPQGDMVLLKLSYEASRFADEEPEDSPPDTTTTQVNTTLLVKPGEAKLVGGTSAESSSLLLVTVTK